MKVCVCVYSSIGACVGGEMAAVRELLRNGSHEANCDSANSSHWRLHKHSSDRKRHTQH